MSKLSAFKLYSEAKQQEGFWIERIKNKFAISIERLMDYRGLKKKDIAERLGVSRPYVTKILRGDANLTMETIGHLAYALDADVTINLSPKESKIKPWLYVLEGSERNSVRDISTSSRRKIADSTKWARLVEGSYRAANA